MSEVADLADQLNRLDKEGENTDEWIARRLARAMAARKLNKPSDCYVSGRQDWPEFRRFQLQFHKSNHIVRAMFPGNGAGKTTVAGVEANYWLQHKHPFLETPAGRVTVIWVCLKFQQMDMLREQLESECLDAGWVWNGAEHKYTWPNGSRMYVISNDGDWAKIQGVAPDLVIMDEECDPKLWVELQMRRRGRKKTKYVISATATKGKRWMFSDVYKPWFEHHEKLGLTEDQAMVAQSHPTIWVWPKGGIEDNPGADRADYDWYEKGVVIKNKAERAIRLAGGFMDLNAAPVFDLDAVEVVELRQKAEGMQGIQGVLLEPKERRFPDHPEFVFQPGPEYEGGRIVIYEPPGDDNYVIGADFGYGLENRDFDYACIVSQKTRRQVAEAEGRWGDVHFAYVLFALGWYFNEALIVGEQQVGLPCMRRMYDEWGYRRFYHERDEKHKSPRPSDDLGHFRHHGDLIIPRLQWAIAPQDEKTGVIQKPSFWWRSPRLIEQFRHYEYKPRSARMELADTTYKDLSMGASAGYHDDGVMAAAYAVTGWIDLPRFKRSDKAFGVGTMGHMLGHREILNPAAKLSSPFKFAKKK